MPFLRNCFHTSSIVRFVEVSEKCNVSQSSLYSLLTTPYNVSFTKLCQYNTEILIFLPCRLTYKKAFFTQTKEEEKNSESNHICLSYTFMLGGIDWWSWTNLFFFCNEFSSKFVSNVSFTTCSLVKTIQNPNWMSPLFFLVASYLCFKMLLLIQIYAVCSNACNALDIPLSADVHIIHWIVTRIGKKILLSYHNVWLDAKWK